MPSAAVFDVDGTLVTFKFDVQGTRAALLREMQESGFDPSGLGLTTPTQTIIDTAGTQAAGNRLEDFLRFRKRAYAILDSFEVDSAITTSAFPGTLTELEYLRSKGVRLAVLTNSGRSAATEVLSRANLDDCFEFVLTRDETQTMKPRPDGLKKAVELLKLPASSVYYVGDSPYDIEAAKGAGVKAISVATGNFSKDKLQERGPDFVISSILELRNVLGV